MIGNDPKCTYIFDNLPYEGDNLCSWIEIVGAPNVIFLEVEENEQIKRAKKKAGDAGSEITPEDSEKAKANIQTATKWL